MTTKLYTAETIKQQISMGRTADKKSGAFALCCWGATQFVGQAENNNDLGNLAFKVSGKKFKGTVKVRLMFNDLYKVEFWKIRGASVQIKKSFDQIYCEDLTETIDNFVEYTKEAAA